jgi:hypothetical protein
MSENQKMIRLTRNAPRGLAVVIAMALAGLLPPAAPAATKGPDAANYTATDATVYSFVDISGGGGGTSVLSGTDDGMAALNLPFSFTFYGQAYSFVCASTNGVLYFVANANACASLPNDFANADLSVSGAPDGTPAVMPFWTDLTFQVPGADSVYYQTLGTAGSRRFIVQWNKAYPQGGPNPVTFQLILSEGTNNVTFQYQAVNLGQGDPANNGASATVGVANNTPVASNQLIEWSYDVPVLSNNYALLFSNAGTPITFQTVPTGLLVSVDNGAARATPFTAALTTGAHTITATPVQPGTPGTQYAFASWSDSGLPQHTITVGASPATYTALFNTQYQLTTGASPVAGGTVTPPTAFFNAGSVVSVKGTANAGYQFANFSGGALSGSTDPQSVTVNAPTNVVANFTPVKPSLAATVGARTPSGGTMNVSLTLTNSGLGIATNATITSITAIADVNGSGTVSVASGLPLSLGTINPGGSATGQLIFNWPTTALRVTFTVNFTADGGYSGSTKITALY